MCDARTRHGVVVVGVDIIVAHDTEVVRFCGSEIDELLREGVFDNFIDEREGRLQVCLIFGAVGVDADGSGGSHGGLSDDRLLLLEAHGGDGGGGLR